jgi:hypothetical protein
MSNTKLQTFTAQTTIDAADKYADTYVDFTSSLITNTFDALIDANLRQIDAYKDYISVISKDLTTYINDTKDDASVNEILNFMESLDLEKFKLIGTDFEGEPTVLELTDEGEIVEVNKDNHVVLRNDDGDLVQVGDTVTPDTSLQNTGKSFSERLFGGLFDTPLGKVVDGIGSVIKNIDIPEETNFGKILNSIKDVLAPSPAGGGQSPTYTYPAIPANDNPDDPSSNTSKVRNITNNLMEAMAIRVQQNKYSLLEEMAKMGFQRNVVDGGHIMTGFQLGIAEENQDSFEKSDLVRVKTKSKVKTKDKTKYGFLPFFKRKNKRTFKQKTNRFEVHKTKVNSKNRTSANVHYDAQVLIKFSTDYKTLES